MSRATYIETTCRTALNRVRGMPFAWSLNPYRGCVHGCHYCYARATHAYYGMNADDDFERRIIVKTNFVPVLRGELARPSWRGERVAIGTATDAYQPCEGRYRITRDALAALLEAGTPVSVVTKSSLVLRDRDLLAAMAAFPGTRVNFTITTLDPALWRLVEPGTPPPAQRLAVMRRLVDAGIPCGVYLAPIMPGLTDDEAAIDAVAKAAREHGASAFWAGPLRLAPLVKEHYLDFISATFPSLHPRYQRAYPGANSPAAYRDRLEAHVARVQERYGFVERGKDEETAPSPAEVTALLPQRRSGQLALPM